MANPPNPVDDFMHWLSVNIFGENIVDNTNLPLHKHKLTLHIIHDMQTSHSTLNQLICRKILTIKLKKPLHLLHHIILNTL
jgi:hypothetical protein